MATTNKPTPDGNEEPLNQVGDPNATGQGPTGALDTAKQAGGSSSGAPAPTATGGTGKDALADPIKAAEQAKAEKDEKSGNGDGVPFELSGPIKKVFPEQLDLKLPPLQRSGVYLAWGVLVMILVFGLTLVHAIYTVELEKPPAEVTVATELLKSAVAQAKAKAGSAPGGMTADEIKPISDLVGQIGTLRRASRDFWTGLAQMLLLNLLLPVLTAILGYVFGRRSEGN